MSAVLFAKPEQRKVTAAALLGGFIPDFSLYFMFFWHQFILGTPTKTIFDKLYFSDYWQKIFALDNSFIVWGIFLGLALFLKSGWAIAMSGAAFVFDQNVERWGVQTDVALGSIATTSSPEAYQVNYVLNANTGSATYNVKGNLKIDDSNGDIFIYS